MGAVSASCRPPAVASPPSRGRRVRSDPPARHPACRGLTVRAPPHRRRIRTYPGPCRLRRRVLIVRAPRRACRSRTGRAPRKRCRVRNDPPARHPACRGLTVRAPSHRRRIRTYPGPCRLRRRVLIVRAPYSPPRRPPTAPTSCTRRRVLIAPIADPPPGHPQPPSPTPPRWPTTCTAGRIPPRRCNSSPKPTMRRCSLPRSACSRFLFSASWPRGTLPRGASTTAGAVPPSGAGSAPSGSTRSPPSAVPWTCCGACSRTGRRLPRNQRAPCSSYSMKRPSIWTTRRLPPTHLTRKEHHPAICRRSSPLKTSADLS